MGYLRNVRAAAAGLVRTMAGLPSSGYYGATNGRRTLNIGNSARGASSLALADGPMLLARARKADMDNPLAHVGINAFVGEVIGTGIRPHSKHKNPTTREKLEREFAL